MRIENNLESLLFKKISMSSCWFKSNDIDFVVEGYFLFSFMFISALFFLVGLSFTEGMISFLLD